MTVKFSKVSLCDKMSCLVRSFLTLLTSAKIGFRSVNYTPDMWPSQSHHQQSSFHKGISGLNFHFIPYPELEIPMRLYTSLYAYYIRKKVFVRRAKSDPYVKVSRLYIKQKCVNYFYFHT